MGYQDYILAADAPTVPQQPAANWERALLTSPSAAADQPRAASGVLESIQAGYQGSATGLMLRGKLPDIVLDHSHASWYEKALASAGQMVSEVPEMIVGGYLGQAAGAGLGATIGSALPVLGTAGGAALGATVGGGAGAFAVPAAIREAYIQALTKGEVESTADFLTRASIVMKSAAKEGLVGGLTMGAGALAGRLLGKTLAPAIGESVSIPTATRAIGTATGAAELGTMVVAPAALEGKMPEPEDFLNAAIVLGGMKGSMHVAGRLRQVWKETGVTPEQVLADANADPKIKAELEAKAEEIVPTAYRPIADAERANRIVPGVKAEEVAASPFATELPQVPGEPTKPTHVNYNAIESPEHVKLALAKLSQVYETEIQQQRRGTVSWEQTSQEAANLLADTLGSRDTRLLMPREPGTAAGAAEILARKQLTIGAAESMSQAATEFLAKGTKASAEDKVAFLATIERAAMIQMDFLGTRAEAGRALNILKSTAVEAERAKQIQDVLTMFEGKGERGRGSPEELAQIIKDLDTPAGALKFAREAAKATRWEQIVEAWKAGILSGPVTHVANVMGNVTFMAMRPPIEAVAATIGMFHGGEKVTAMEPIARILGNMQGALDGIKMAAAIMRHGEEVGKAEQFRQAIPGKAGEVIRLPFRFLSAADAMFKTMNERGEAYALASRRASGEGLNPLTREFRERVAEMVENPDEAMQKASEEAGLRFTFNTPLGEKGAAIQKLVQQWHLQLFVPFIRTPGNILKELVRMTPASPLVSEWRKAISEGGAHRDKAIAELAVGSALMGSVAALVMNETITGQGSADPNKRRVMMAGGWQPYSIKIGKTYYNYQRLQPIGTLVGLAADLAEVWDHLDTDEADKIPKMLSVAFANAVTNQTFLQGITNLVNAASDPGRFGPRLAQSYAGSIVPAAIGQTTQLSDPVQREVNSMLDAIKARVPGARQTLLPKRDIYGAEVQTKERLGGLSPITATTESDDKVRSEGARLGLSISDVPKKVHVGRGTGKLGDVKLTPEQHDVFAQESGKVAHDALANIVNSPDWDEKPDLVKRRIYKRVFLIAHRVGAIKALPPEERVPLVASIAEQIEAEMGAGQ